jgi:hypothetical protein
MPDMPEIGETQPSSKLLERLAQRAAEKEAAQKAEEEKANKWAEFVVQVEPEELGQISPEQKALDDFISLINIDNAYNQWAQKGPVKTHGRRESVKVRCPNPDHPDINPSAWLNLDKNVFNCARCGGGDKWDIAAWRFGFPVPQYKQDKESFRSLREKIGEYFGMHVTKGVAGDVFLTKTPGSPDIENSLTNPPDQEQEPSAGQDTSVSYLPAGSEFVENQVTDEDLQGRKYPSIDWKSIVPENTFLRAYLEETSKDDSPEEFHFWNGLIAVGMAVGVNRYLEDTPFVFGNLFLCTVGSSGTGKSKSKRHLINLIHDALPYDRTSQPPDGAQYLTGVQSGEVLIKSFQHDIIDMVTGKPTGKQWPGIRGCIEFDELASLIGKSSRLGSTLKTTLMELYDAPRWLASTSMTHGAVVAEKPFGSVITTTQFKSVRELISRADDNAGFANRWFYATGIKKKPFSVNRAYIDLTRAKGLLGAIQLATRTPEVITWNAKAEAIWDDFFHNTFIAMRDKSDQTIIQRIDLLMKKLFLLFAVNERSTGITESIVQRVLSLFNHIFESYGVIEQQINATNENDDTAFIVRTIGRLTSSKGRGPTPRDIFEASKTRFGSVSKLRKMLENLVVLGMIEEFKIPPGPKGGRPTSCFVVSGTQVTAQASQGGAN